jgi:hypothetical protein
MHKKHLSFAKKAKNVRKFALLLTGVILVHYFVAVPFEWSLHLPIVGFLLVGMLLTQLLQPFLYLWMWIGTLLGEITSTIILGVVFFILLLPISLFVKKKNDNTGWKKASTFSDHDKLF